MVTSFPGYATRIYRRPADFGGRWKTLFIKPSPSGSTRGGFIIPLEGDRWQVALVGMAGDYPPTGEACFLEFAASLPVPHLYEAIKSAQPLSKPCGYRRTESRVRHYEHLPRYLDGFVVLGDAVYTLNPVYAQGMTVAAMASQALDACLQNQRSLSPAGDLTGLAGRFQQELSRSVAGIWQMVTREDLRWPQAEMVENFIPARSRAGKPHFGPQPKRRKTSGIFLAPLPA
jgi:flavin-dependent dehydrogenase